MAHRRQPRGKRRKDNDQPDQQQNASDERHAGEIEQTLALIRQAKQQLDERGEPYERDIEVGGMIEIPAAALALPMFMRRLNFLSIGTNDLIQYTLAIDRTDDSVAHLYDPLHPAVLTLVANTIQTATRRRRASCSPS